MPSSKDDGREYHPSNAETQTPAADLVKDLRGEGKTDRELSVILQSKGYNMAEQLKALPGYGPAGLKALREGRDPKAKQNSGAGGATVQMVRADPTLNTEGGPQKGRMADNPPGASQEQSYRTSTERGAALAEVLGPYAGANTKKVQAAINFYEAHEEDFDANPMRLMGVLTGAGFSWIKARDAVTEFLTQVNPDSVFTPFMGGSISASQGAGVAPWMVPYMPREEKTSGSFSRMDAMFDRMIEFRMISQMMRETGGEERYGAQEPDPVDKAIERMSKISMLKMLSSVGTGSPSSPVSPFMAVETEPIVDAEGKPVVDQFGTPMYRVKQTPIMMGGGEKEKPDYEPIKILADALTSSNQSKADMATQLVDVMKDSTERQVNMLQTRLEGLEGQDPLETVSAVLDKVQDWGFGKDNESLETVKINADLKKWMHEQDIQLQRWIQEQRMAMEDKRYQKAQMKEFNDTLKVGITKIGEPLAEAMKQGFVEGRRGGNGREAPQPQRGRPGKDISDMTDAELADLYGQSRNSERIVKEAQAQIVGEMQRRGHKAPPGEITN